MFYGFLLNLPRFIRHHAWERLTSGNVLLFGFGISQIVPDHLAVDQTKSLLLQQAIFLLRRSSQNLDFILQDFDLLSHFGSALRAL